MSDRLITAEEARDMLENKVTPYPYTGDPFSGFKDANGELVVWEDDITGDTCTTPQFISGALIAPRLMETIIAQAGQIDTLKDSCKTLGQIVTWMQTDTVRAAGLGHLLNEDGDGDWGLIWELIWQKLREHKTQGMKLDDQADTMRRLIRDRDEWEGNAEEQADIVERQAAQIKRLQKAVTTLLADLNEAEFGIYQEYETFSTPPFEPHTLDEYITAEDMEDTDE